MAGCVAAIYGVIIKTREPTQQEVKIPKHYRSRKGDLVFLLWPDAMSMEFVFASSNFSGSTHDSLELGSL
jgi:hypothetical protein